MAIYRIREDAKEDLRRIYFEGLKKFGEAQADKYYAAFFDRFQKLAEQPNLYQAVDELREGYRRSVCGSDTIYYRLIDGGVEIMNILGQQDTDDWLT